MKYGSMGKQFACFAGIACLCAGLVLMRDYWSDPMALLRPDDRFFLLLRLRQMLVAFCVGAGLAVSGTACQAVLRNDLADPYLLGVSGGAGCGAAAVILLGWAVQPMLLPLGAFCGAAAALFLVLGLARGGGSTGIVLGGVVVGSVCSSVLMFFISIMTQHELNSITWWLLGSLQFCEDRIFGLVAFLVVAGSVALFALGREANAIAMGDELAHDFGVSAARGGVLILLLAALLAASTVALVGVIGFVGLIVPHILRRFFGADHRKLFPAAFGYGGLFLILCDGLAQSVYREQEVPIGVVTSLLGGPFFLWLLYREQRGRGRS